MQRSDWDPDWERIKEICALALDLSPPERSNFIASTCLHDPFLISEVNSLVAARDTDKLIGTTIDGRYYVERELDEGAMGKVYLAFARRLDNRPVVIKVLLETSLRNADIVQLFRDEAVALSRINHPGVVGILDAGELSDGTPYLVMQHVDGKSLRRHIAPEGMEVNRVAAILKDICDALEHVHERGIFHRDLKPENIMIESATGAVKIVDFGVAKVKDSAVAPGTASKALIGTVSYMSPERLRGEPSTAASDIYSMAVIAYEMLTGRRPFYPRSIAQLTKMQQRSAMPLDQRPELSPAAERILRRGLSFKPRGRPNSAKEFGDAFARALVQPSRPADLPKRMLALAAIVIGIALFSLGIYHYRRNTPEKPPGHALTYSLTVQKMREGKNYQEPFKSFGGETFESGDKFRLDVSSGEPGYLYLLNEGPPESDKFSFRLVYPRRATNQGSATVGANQPVRSDWITFRGPAGTENFWIVWSASPVDELEAAKAVAFNLSNEGLTDLSLIRVKEFLKRKQLETKVRITRYRNSQTAVIRGTADLLVALVEFRHR